MLKEYMDISFPENNIFSLQEEVFKKNILLKFGVVVRQTVFLKGGESQYFLYVWVDNDAVWDEKQVIACYLESFGYNESDYPEVHLFPENLRKSRINYAYGHAIDDLRNTLKTDRRCSVKYVLLEYVTVSFIIICDGLTDSIADEYRETCYRLLKKYDHYGFVERSDLRVSFLSSGLAKALGKELNDTYILNS